MVSRVLFVCLGNICRSPTAEGVFKHLTTQKSLNEEFIIDSAGTSGHHDGEMADSRMIEHASRRGIELTSLSRKFVTQDFDNFDYIIGMDDSNLRNIERLARNEDDKRKVSKMTDYCSDSKYDEVPDPYYGGADGFEVVLDLVIDASNGLLEKIKGE